MTEKGTSRPGGPSIGHSLGILVLPLAVRDGGTAGKSGRTPLSGTRIRIVHPSQGHTHARGNSEGNNPAILELCAVRVSRSLEAPLTAVQGRDGVGGHTQVRRRRSGRLVYEISLEGMPVLGSDSPEGRIWWSSGKSYTGVSHRAEGREASLREGENCPSIRYNPGLRDHRTYNLRAPQTE